MPWPPYSLLEVRGALGEGLVGRYVRDGTTWWYEGERPGAGWHRHDWRPHVVVAVLPTGVTPLVVYRRRWLLYGTTETRQDRAPDEVDRVHAVVLVVLVQLWSWLSSTRGLHHYDAAVPSLERQASRRTVQRWLQRLLPAATRLQQALRTTVIERHEPRPIEKLFPGGLSPPGCARRRWWKDPEATLSLATGLAFLFGGAVALSTSATVLLAEARRRLDGPLGMTGF